MNWTPPKLGLAIAAAVLIFDQGVKAIFLYGLGWISTLGLPGNGIRFVLIPRPHAAGQP